jgi:hypothetical protein
MGFTAYIGKYALLVIAAEAVKNDVNVDALLLHRVEVIESALTTKSSALKVI